MLTTPIITYDDLDPQEVSDLIAKATALTNFVPGAQKRITFSSAHAIAEPEEESNILHTIRQGIEDDRVLRKIRYCEIDWDSGTGGVREYVCLWDDEPDIDNWRGKPQNPYTDILPGEPLHARCRVFKREGVGVAAMRPSARRCRTPSG